MRWLVGVVGAGWLTDARRGFGDRLPLALLYLTSMALAVVVVARSSGAPIERRRAVAVGLISAAVAIDTALGISDRVARESRYRALREGWYVTRRPLQILAVAAVVIAAGAVVLTAIRWTRARRGDGDGVAAWGSIALGMVGVLAVRALRLVSLHHVDRAFSLGPESARLGKVLEWAAVFVVVIGLVVVARDLASQRRVAPGIIREGGGSWRGSGRTV